jgi:hypothetical protein
MTTNKPPRETRKERRLRLMSEFASALLISKTIGEAAQRVGIAERTGRLWMRTPEYLGFYTSLNQPKLSSIVRVLRTMTVQANEALMRVLKDEKAAATAIVAAAKAVHDGVIRFTELEDLESRLRELEAIAQGGAQK